MSKTWRTALVGVVVMGLVAGVFSLAPARALAQQFLSIFRVNKFVAVEVDPSAAQIESLSAVLGDKLAQYEPQTLADEPEVSVDSIEAARAQAGFQARMPSYLPGDGDVTFSVKGRTELAATVDREGVALVLQTAGMDDSALPADWAGGEVRALAPAMVNIARQNADTMLVQVFQVPGARVEYPTGLEPQVLGEAGLRLLGLPAREARSIAEKVDWTSTLLLPVPSALASFRETRIAGEEAIALTFAQDEEYGVLRAIVWQKDDVLYCVLGIYSDETLARVAESMF
jgi:hypothetical protein